MERLTKYVKGVVWYNYKGNKYPAYDMDNSDMLHALDRLGQLEDEAEQRERGCEFCNGIAKFWLYGVSFGVKDGIPVFIPGMGKDALETDFIIYCPRCGRKLVE